MKANYTIEYVFEKWLRISNENRGNIKKVEKILDKKNNIQEELLEKTKELLIKRIKEIKTSSQLQHFFIAGTEALLEDYHNRICDKHKEEYEDEEDEEI